MNVGEALSILIRAGGITIQVDPKLPSGEFYVQILRNKGSYDQMACGYYPTVDAGLEDCLYQLHGMLKQEKDRFN